VVAEEKHCIAKVELMGIQIQLLDAIVALNKKFFLLILLVLNL
jgi:hypothetical protein